MRKFLAGIFLIVSKLTFAQVDLGTDGADYMQANSVFQNWFSTLIPCGGDGSQLVCCFENKGNWFSCDTSVVKLYPDSQRVVVYLNQVSEGCAGIWLNDFDLSQYNEVLWRCHLETKLAVDSLTIEMALSDRQKRQTRWLALAKPVTRVQPLSLCAQHLAAEFLSAGSVDLKHLDTIMFRMKTDAKGGFWGNLVFSIVGFGKYGSP